MELEKLVKGSIYSYPLSYRSTNYEMSRIFVLNHLFLCYGTGYEWNIGGYLKEEENFPYTKDRLIDELPQGFFEKDLVYIDIIDKNVDVLSEELVGHFFYTVKNWHDRTCFIIENSVTLAEILKKHLDDKVNRLDLIFDELNLSKALNKNFLNPYPMSNYSPIQEIYEGVTSYLGVIKPVYPQPDWLQGAIDIAKYAISYYQNDERFVNHTYYWERTYNLLKWDIEKAKNENKLEEFYKARPHLKVDDLKQYSIDCWEKYKTGEIEFMQKFLKKFDK